MMNHSSSTTKTVGEVATVQTKLTWRIENIKEHCKLSKIISPTFTVKTGDLLTKWKLLLILEDDKGSEMSKNNEKYLKIKLMSLNPESMRALIHFCILGPLNRELNCTHAMDREFKLNGCYGFKRFISQKYLSRVTESHCTFVCTITTNEFIEVDSENHKLHSEQLSRLSEFDQLGQLFLNKKFSDVIIVVEGKEIHAHKNFLANKSPVFEAMFTHDVLESNNNRVEIPDISFHSMFNMLKYIYTGVIQAYFGEDLYKDLLIASDKYCIKSLKHEYEKKLSDFLEVDNIFEYLNFADMHNAAYLKEKVVEYIVNHGEDVAALPSFNKHCSKLHPDLYGEVFRALVTKKRKIG